MLTGYIRSTLDHSQTETILATIRILDLPGTWKALLESYEPKDSASRTNVLQELVALCKGSSGFETESYQDYRSRCVALAACLTSLLLKRASITPATTCTLTIGSGDNIHTGQEMVTPASLSSGYTAANLARDLALSMIPIGLGKDDDNLL